MCKYAINMYTYIPNCLHRSIHSRIKLKVRNVKRPLTVKEKNKPRCALGF